MADAHGGGHKGGGAHKKPAAHGAHSTSEGPSGWMMIALGIVAIVLLIMFYSGAIGPSIPANY